MLFRALGAIPTQDFRCYSPLKVLEGFLQLVQINRLNRFFRDESSDRVDIQADDFASEPKGFNDCCATTHEWVKDDFVLAVFGDKFLNATVTLVGRGMGDEEGTDDRWH